MSLNTHSAAAGKLVLRLIVQTVFWMGLMAALLFWSAGTWRWPQAWAFLALFLFLSVAFSLWLLLRDPALLNSRLHVMQKGQSIWDRAWISIFIALWCAWFALMGLDAQRFHWSVMPLPANIAGGVLMAAGFLATMIVFRANSFASPAVRLQEERGQRVIDTGPYALVRHPMYAASILYLFGIPLMLGSAYGLIVPPVFVIGVAVRAIFEERLLARELPGYADYMNSVRWRLIPYIW